MRLETADGRALEVNFWNWGVLHDIVAKRRLFAEDVWSPKRQNGGGLLDGTQCARLAEFLADEVLPYLGPGERLFYDGTVTAEPDDGTFHRGEAELWKNYSLHRDVLTSAIAFFREASGPVGFY